MNARARLAMFVLVFVVLYVAVQASPAFQHAFIEGLTVPTAAWLINATGLAGMPVAAIGSRLVAAGGGLNVLQGCEGLDLLCLWLAATAAGPFGWRARLLAATLGSVLVFALNQLRLVSLFHLYRNHREWFGDAHGLWWPLLLVAAVWGLFALWQRAAPAGGGMPATP